MHRHGKILPAVRSHSTTRSGSTAAKLKVCVYSIQIVYQRLNKEVAQRIKFCVGTVRPSVVIKLARAEPVGKP